MLRLLVALQCIWLHACVSVGHHPSRALEIRDERLESIGGHTKNLEIIDWNAPVPNQDTIGSCQSFAFTGMVENQAYNRFGVAIDLSERYLLLSNYSLLGGMGGEPDNVSRLQESMAAYGTLPEDVYPYQAILANAPRFESDAAQGIVGSADVKLQTLLAGKPQNERWTIAQDSRFLGPLPTDKYPVTIPIFVKKADSLLTRSVTELASGENVVCFTEGTAKHTKVLKLTPEEFARHCLEYDKDAFESISVIDFVNSADSTAVCQSDSSKNDFTKQVTNFRANALFQVLKGLQGKNAAMIGFPVPEPIPSRTSVIWSLAGNESPVAGHAVLALGYLTAASLQDDNAQDSGILGSGLFDNMAKAYDSLYQAPDASDDLSSKRAKRVASKYGDLILREQGILLFRNSWGKVAGLDGYQAQTFDYFLRHGLLSTTFRALGMEIGVPIALKVDEQVTKLTRAWIDTMCASH